MKNRGLRHNTGLLCHTPHHNVPCNVLVFTGESQKERFAWKDICIRPQLWENFKLYKFVSWNKLRYFTWGTGGRETTGSRTAASISWWFLHPSPLRQLGIHNILATTKHLKFMQSHVFTTLTSDFQCKKQKIIYSIYSKEKLLLLSLYITRISHAFKLCDIYKPC